MWFVLVILCIKESGDHYTALFLVWPQAPLSLGHNDTCLIALIREEKTLCVCVRQIETGPMFTDSLETSPTELVTLLTGVSIQSALGEYVWESKVTAV